LTLKIGETKTLIANVSPENAENKTVVFTSSNVLVASVMPNGLVTAISKGTATIVVTTVDGAKSASCEVTVEEVSVTGITLNKETLELAKDDTEMLTATVLPTNATNKNVTWASSDPDVATVSDGTVTAKTAGTATITVTTENGNKTANCELQVTAAIHVESVSLDKTQLSLKYSYYGGGFANLTATVLPANALNKKITWSSSNNSVASVTSEYNESAEVTAKGQGTAIITVTTQDGNRTANCTVSVVNDLCHVRFKKDVDYANVTDLRVYGSGYAEHHFGSTAGISSYFVIGPGNRTIMYKNGDYDNWGDCPPSISPYNFQVGRKYTVGFTRDPNSRFYVTDDGPIP